MRTRELVRRAVRVIPAAAAISLLGAGAAQAQVSIDIAESEDPVPAGRDVTYTVSITNNGSTAIGGPDGFGNHVPVLVLGGMFGSQFDLRSASPSQGSCENNDSDFSCQDVGPIGAGSKVTVTVVSKALGASPGRPNGGLSVDVSWRYGSWQAQEQTAVLPAPQGTPGKTVKPGRCARLRGKRRRACIKRRCGRLKGARKRACVRRVTRKPAPQRGGGRPPTGR